MSRSLGSSYSKSLFRTTCGFLRQLRAQLLQLAELRRGEPGEHRLRDRAAVQPADAPLNGQAFLGQCQADATAVPWVRRAADETPVRQPVDHPGQGRLAEQDVAVELTQADRVRALGQRVEDVVLLHGKVPPDVLRVELPDQRAVGGEERLPRVVGGVSVRYFCFSIGQTPEGTGGRPPGG